MGLVVVDGWLGQGLRQGLALVVPPLLRSAVRVVGGGCLLLTMLGCWLVRGLVQVFLLCMPFHSIVIKDQTTNHCVH